MSRAARSVPARKRKNKVLKFVKGYRGRSSKCYVLALRAMQRALAYNYIHRKQKKRDFRRLWIMRINAGLRSLGYTYSDFIMRLNRSNIIIDRKMIAHIAVSFSKSFESLVRTVMSSDDCMQSTSQSKAGKRSAV